MLLWQCGSCWRRESTTWRNGARRWKGNERSLDVWTVDNSNLPGTSEALTFRTINFFFFFLNSVSSMMKKPPLNQCWLMYFLMRIYSFNRHSCWLEVQLMSNKNRQESWKFVGCYFFLFPVRTICACCHGNNMPPLIWATSHTLWSTRLSSWARRRISGPTEQLKQQQQQPSDKLLAL